MNASDKRGLAHKEIHLPPRWIVVIVTCACLLPFIDKAVNIDDPIFIWGARQILSEPLDPMGFDMNWYGWVDPAWKVNQNPYLVPYMLAVVAGLLGFSEIALHLGMMIPAVFLALGILALAQVTTKKPLVATLLAVLTPVTLVSATTIMTDIPMLTFYVWALYWWRMGLEEDKPSHLWIAVGLMCCSGFSKYFGFTLLPLFAAMGLFKYRRPGSWCLPLALPVVALAGYMFLTQSLYGADTFGQAASYTMRTGESKHFLEWLYRLATGLSFSGGCMLTIFLVLPFMWSLRQWLTALLVYIALALVLWFTLVHRLHILGDFKVMMLFQFTLFVGFGAYIARLALADWFKRRDNDALMLCLWLGGTFAFSTLINWATTARTILPMVVPCAILMVRAFEDETRQQRLKRAYRFALVSGAALSLLVCFSDYMFAQSQRNAANFINTRFAKYPNDVYFQGHWGFQYYMEEKGFKAMSLKSTQFKQNDLVIIPLDLSNTILPRESGFSRVGTMQFATLPFLSTMESETAAGFYFHGMGALPYSFGMAPPQEYSFWLIGEQNLPLQQRVLQYLNR